MINDFKIEQITVTYNGKKYLVQETDRRAGLPSVAYRRLMHEKKLWSTPRKKLTMAEEWLRLGFRDTAIELIADTFHPKYSCEMQLLQTAEFALSANHVGLAEQLTNNPTIKHSSRFLRYKLNWWLAHLKGETQFAEKTLLTAEHCAESYSDLILCASGWALLDRKQEMELLMVAAESKAKTTSEWIECARFWLSIHRLPETLRCMENAELLADYYYPLSQCVPVWIELNDYERAKKTVIAAEHMATNALSWSMIGSHWSKLSDLKNAVRCLVNAGIYINNDVFEWCIIAGEWITLGERQQATQCLARAKRMISSTEDYQTCASFSEQIDTKDATMILMYHAEETADTCKRMLCCASQWGELGYRENARKCIKKAETLIRNATDWKSCLIWWQSLGEYLEVERFTNNH